MGSRQPLCHQDSSHYEGEEFPSRTYGRDVYAYLSNIVWPRNENQTTKYEIDIGIMIIIITIVTVIFTRWKHLKK